MGNSKDYKFQFHYGTIKRKKSEASAKAALEFQFHYGTIKSTLAVIFLLLIEHFNSTMVRLKGKRFVRIPA